MIYIERKEGDQFSVITLLDQDNAQLEQNKTRTGIDQN